MKLFQGATIEEAAKALQQMRGWKPFEYGGTWYFTSAKEDGLFAAYRTKKAAATNANGNPVFKVS